MATDEPKKAVAKKAARKAPAKKIPRVDPAAKKAVRKAPAKKAAPPDPLAYHQVRIGKRVYPVMFDPGCHVCRHPKRALVEEQILLGTSFASISRSMSNMEYVSPTGEMMTWPELRTEWISRHYNKDHCPINADVLADLREQQVDADEYGRVGRRIVSGIGFANRILGRVDERVVRGEIEPTVKDGIQAARLVTAVEMAARAAEEGEEGDSEMFFRQAIDVLLEQATRFIPAENRDKFVEALRTNPVLNELYARQQDAPKELTA